MFTLIAFFIKKYFTPNEYQFACGSLIYCEINAHKLNFRCSINKKKSEIIFALINIVHFFHDTAQLIDYCCGICYQSGIFQINLFNLYIK